MNLHVVTASGSVNFNDILPSASVDTAGMKKAVSSKFSLMLTLSSSSDWLDTRKSSAGASFIFISAFPEALASSIGIGMASRSISSSAATLALLSILFEYARCMKTLGCQSMNRSESKEEILNGSTYTPFRYWFLYRPTEAMSLDFHSTYGKLTPIMFLIHQ